MSRLPRYPLTVFYDRSCPLCAEEMHALKARDRWVVGIEAFEVVYRAAGLDNVARVWGA
ncbi:MAG TPA: hypothetical protein VFC18_19280 [Burkholderiales bacterium]|nr:hypothetical protein [Burkholderiales bacterium]